MNESISDGENDSDKDQPHQVTLSNSSSMSNESNEKV